MSFHYKPILLCVFLLSAMLHASDYADNTRSLFNLPRSSAVSGSNFAFERDGSPQSNPANMSADGASEASLAYASFYQNVFTTSTFSYVTSIDSMSGFGFSLNYAYVPDISDNRNFATVSGEPVYDPSNEINSSYSDLYFHAAYSRDVAKTSMCCLSTGIAVNAGRQRLPTDGFKGYSLGFDAGVAIGFPRIGLKTGLACENITTQVTHWSSSYSEQANPELHFGIGWQKSLPYIYGQVFVSYKSLDFFGNEGINTVASSSLFTSDTGNAEITKTFKQQTAVATPAMPGMFLMQGNFGIEYCIKEIFTLRVGGNVFNNVAFGCGVNLFQKRISIDAAYISHDLAPTYQIAMTYQR